MPTVQVGDVEIGYESFGNGPPLLFIMGGKDHLMPPSVIRSNAKKYRNSSATTDTHEFPDRSHFTGVEPGWEQVADYALAWATSHARPRRA